jgi:gamma-tubulin complex component 2
MIQERSSITKDRLKDDFNDVYWEQRYTLTDSVPSFLEPYKEKILLTGKYLNVLRECSLEIEVDDTADHSFSNLSAGHNEVVKVVQGQKFLEMIETYHAKSNKVLLDLLFKKQNLMDRLR